MTNPDRVVDPAVYEFINSQFGQEFTSLPELAHEHFHGLCEAINGAYAAWMESNGEEGVELVDYVSRDNTPIGPGYAHTVIRTGTEIIDLTYGQLDPSAPIPAVFPRIEWENTWRPLQARSGAEILDEYSEDYLYFTPTDPTADLHWEFTTEVG